MAGLSEEFLREAFIEWNTRETNLILSYFNNVWINYDGLNFDSSPGKNEADIIIFERAFKTFNEIEIKKSQTDWLREINAVRVARDSVNGIPDSLNTVLVNRWPCEKSKIRKFTRIFKGESMMDSFSFLVPSYLYHRFLKKYPFIIKTLEQCGFGLIVYTGGGEFEVVLPFRRLSSFYKSPSFITDAALYLTSQQSKRESINDAKPISTKRRNNPRKKKRIQHGKKPSQNKHTRSASK